MNTEALWRTVNYEPRPPQKRFHDSRARFKGFCAPDGSGKSEALVHEALRLSFQNPGRTGVLCSPTYAMLRHSQSTLFRILDAAGILYWFSMSMDMLTFNQNGSRILFRSVEDFERLRGTNLAWFGVDELTQTPEEAWTWLEGRLRDTEAVELCGFGVWTPDWVYKRFREADHDVIDGFAERAKVDG